MRKKPFILVNVAVSADGKLSTCERRQVKISGQDDFDRVDKIKSGADAIMVGIGTVLSDDPSLTVKSAERISERLSIGRPEHPIRIIIDSQARTPPGAKILHKGPGRRIIAVSNRAPRDRIAVLEQYAEVLICGDEKVDLLALCAELGRQDIGRIMVEGGGTLIASLFRDDLVDQLSVYIGNIIIGGSNAPTLADGEGWIHENDFTNLTLISLEPMDNGVLINWKIARQ